MPELGLVPLDISFGMVDPLALPLTDPPLEEVLPGTVGLVSVTLPPELRGDGLLDEGRPGVPGA